MLKLICSFDGALLTKILHNPDLAFKFKATFRITHRLAPKVFFRPKPPLHFHPYQEEWIKVISGILVVEVDRETHILTPDDASFCVRPWTHHRLYPAAPKVSSREQVTVPLKETVVLLWAEKTKEPFQLDVVFLENWFRYGEDILMNGRSPSLLQVLCVIFTPPPFSGRQ